MDAAVVSAGPETSGLAQLGAKSGIGCSLALQKWRSEESAAVYLHKENGMSKTAETDAAESSVIDMAAAGPNADQVEPAGSEPSSRSSRNQSPESARSGIGISEEEPAKSGSGLTRLARLARRVVQDEVSEWVPDAEEKAIIARAVKRLQEKLALEVDPERSKLQRVQIELNRRKAVQAAQPSRSSIMETRNRAEYQLSQPEDSQPSSPIPGRRKGILRTTSSASFTAPQITVSEAVDLPIQSTTAAKAFGGYTFPRDAENLSPEQTPRNSQPATSNTPSPVVTPRAGQTFPRLPLKPRSSAVSIAETEELLEFPEEASPGAFKMSKHSVAHSLVSDSTATGVSASRRSSTVASAKAHRSPRQSLANIFRFKDSQIPMGLSRRSDLELGWALSQALQEAAASGQLQDLAALRKRSTPTTEAPSSPAATMATSSPSCIKLDPEPSSPSVTPSEEPTHRESRDSTRPVSLVDASSVEDLILQHMAAFKEETRQRDDAWRADLQHSLQEEQSKELTRLQAGLAEGLEALIEGRLSSFQAELGQRSTSQRSDEALKDEVRTLQSHLERVEETQSDLLQQMKQAEAALESTLGRHLALHQEALEERCAELQGELKAATKMREEATVPSNDRSRPEESAERLETRLEMLEERLQDQSDRKSVSSVEEVIFDSSELKEEVAHVVAELEARMAVNLQAVRDEISEQTRVLRSHCDHQVGKLEETTEQQVQALEDLRRQLNHRMGAAANREDVTDDLEEAQMRLKEEVAAETLAVLEAKYDKRMHNFEDCMETRRSAQQREFERMFTDLHRSMSKLEGSQKALVTKTLPEVEAALAEALGRERAEQQDRLHRVAQLYNKKVDNALSLGESTMQKLSTDMAQLEQQLRDFTSSECDAVLQALRGRIVQDEEERVISMTAVRQEISELKAALGPALTSPDHLEETSAGLHSCKSPVVASLATLTSPARAARSPFAGVGGAVQSLDASCRKKSELCRRKAPGTPTPRARTPR